MKLTTRERLFSSNEVIYNYGVSWSMIGKTETISITPPDLHHPTYQKEGISII